MKPRPTDSVHPEIDDDERIAIFREFLTETPNGAVLLRDLTHAPDYFPNRTEFEAWRARWLPYLAGLADGPTDPAQYAALRPRLFGLRRPETDAIDRFHA